MTTSDYLEQLIQDRDDLVDNLTTKGISGLTGDETFTELVPEVLNIPSGGGGTVEEKDVNFYDYDGTITNSYTAQEFLALSSMPDNPTHEGLTSQGWNWTLTDAQDYVEDYGACDIGQMYVTDDGATRVYITLDERLDPQLGFSVNGTVTINWGDGNIEDVTGTGSFAYYQHIYSAPGDYVISFDSESTITIGGSSSQYFIKPLANTQYASASYRVKKIEIGNAISMQAYSFYRMLHLENLIIPSGKQLSQTMVSGCPLIKHLTIPTSADYYDTFCSDCIGIQSVSLPYNAYWRAQQSMFSGCSALKRVILPKTITFAADYVFRNCTSLNKVIIPMVSKISTNMFTACYMLKEIEIPSSVTSIGNNAFSNCYSLGSMIIPSSVTSIGSGAFSGCYGVMYYDFSDFTTIPTLNSGAFSSIVSDCKIIVPDSLYDEWVAATNWSTYADYIIKESEWND